ncbi:Oxygen-dependent choline dehydrogenase [Folsomia candida]|uniref:Oxygen-dependent choline dehydrogenase n=1 Tax=Folsomia candida TaxID=158441 RepID=A0A226DKW3_FOLCA|nr:Oxygen-dependent choline dehydrogenase [Folsomia candida]
MKLAAFLFGTIPLVINFYVKKYIEDDKAVTLRDLEGDFGIPRIKSYDFIVVGGGTAGCVVAGRLSEKFNVLLLESGGNPVPQSEVNFFTRQVATDPDSNYLYKSIPQRNMSLSNGGIVGLETGKMLGGSGSHNDLCHQRGSPHDWDSYAAMVGDASWSYQNVLPLFKKTENFVGQLLNPEESDYYGYDGPLTVGTHLPAIFSKWAEAGIELGYPVADPNAQQIPSFAPIQKLIGEDGRRVSTYKSYIAPFEATRQNLTVVRYSTVTRILLDSSNRAYGVAYLRHGIPQIAHASKEVILSAGAINSPLVLMMSGIGPRDVLEAAEIPVLVDLPNVGQNLADHVFLYLGPYSFNSSAAPFLPRIREEDLEEALTTYLNTGFGEFGELQEGPQVFYVSSRAVAEGQGTWPDARINLDAACPMIMDDDVESQACFFFELDRPKSRGSVSLNTDAYVSGVTNFVELADIDFNGFRIDLVSDIIETRAFQSMGASYAGTPISGCTGVPFLSREYWVCYINQLSTTAIHMVGTCAMGAVTDSKLRVFGVPGLRVVDASVLPATPNANLNYPVILVGEKAAEDIMRDWGGRASQNNA